MGSIDSNIKSKKRRRTFKISSTASSVKWRDKATSSRPSSL